jgi:hypothetical protein
MLTPRWHTVRPRQHCYAALWPETSEARQICENSCKGTGHVTFALSVPVSSTDFEVSGDTVIKEVWIEPE